MKNVEKLMSQLPIRFGISKKIAEKLNNEGVKTRYGRQYTPQNVVNALKGKHEDDRVLIELVDMVAAYNQNKSCLDKKIKNMLSKIPQIAE